MKRYLDRNPLATSIPLFFVSFLSLFSFFFKACLGLGKALIKKTWLKTVAYVVYLFIKNKNKNDPQHLFMRRQRIYQGLYVVMNSAELTIPWKLRMHCATLHATHCGRNNNKNNNGATHTVTNQAGQRESNFDRAEGSTRSYSKACILNPFT